MSVHNILKWGDTVRIYGRGLTKKNLCEGLILSKGFTDAKVYYFPTEYREEFKFDRESFFYILPQVSFEKHDELMECAAGSREYAAGRKGLERELYNLESKARSLGGTGVVYGSTVLLRHVSSKYYLRGGMRATEESDGAFQVYVSSHVCSQALWKLISHRSFQHEGDPIYYDDFLRIYHEGSDCFINFVPLDFNYFDYIFYSPYTDPQFGSIKSFPQTPSHTPYHISSRNIRHAFLYCRSNEIKNAPKYYSFSHRVKKLPLKLTSLVNYSKPKSYWRFILQSSFTRTPLLTIHPHGLVFLQHTQNDGLIAVNHSTPNQIIIKYIKGGAKNYDCIWEIIPFYSSLNTNDNKEALCFQARNIVTGRKLQLNETNIYIVSKQDCAILELQTNSLISLRCYNSLLDREDIIIDYKGKSKIEDIFESYCYNYSVQRVEQLTKDSFRICCVEEKEELNLQFVISSQYQLWNLCVLIETFNEERKSNKEKIICFKKLYNVPLEKVANVVKLLTGLIESGGERTIDSTVQQILVDTGTVELVVELIKALEPLWQCIIAEGSKPTDDRAQRMHVLSLFEYCYLLLAKACSNNPASKVYLARWAPQFLQHFVEADYSYTADCVSCIFHRNPEAVASIFHAPILTHLITSFLNQPFDSRTGDLATKYLQLFSLIIQAESKNQREIQTIILQYFFTKPYNALSFSFRIYEKERYEKSANKEVQYWKVMMIYGKQDFTSLPRFFRDFRSKWNYFIAYVNLLSDVCLNRNEEAIRCVMVKLPLRLLTTLLVDGEVHKLDRELWTEHCQREAAGGKSASPDILTPFLLLLQHVYLRNSHFHPVRRVQKIFRWYASHQCTDINKTIRLFQGEKEIYEKHYLDTIFLFFQQYLCSISNNPFLLHTNPSQLHTVLSLLSDSINFGLWDSILHLRKLLCLIVRKVLSFSPNFFFPYHQPTLADFTKAKIYLKEGDHFKPIHINCRKLGAVILYTIFDFETDIRIRYFMKFFKGVCYSTYPLFQAGVFFNKQGFKSLEYGIKSLEYRFKNLESGFNGLEDKIEAHNNNEFVFKLETLREANREPLMWENKIRQLTPYQKYYNENRWLFDTSFEYLVYSLFECAAFNDDDILEASLQMLRRLFSQRSILLAGVKSVLVCGKGSLQYLWVLFGDVERRLSEWDCNRSVSSTEKLYRQLSFLARTMLYGANLKSLYQLQYRSNTNNFLSEKDANNVLFQSFNLAEGIYLRLLKFIAEEHTESSNLLCTAYHYLTLLCFDNLPAKRVLAPHLEWIMRHVWLGVGAPKLVHHICVGNRLLVCNLSQVTTLVEGVLSGCLRLGRDEEGYYERAKALLSLRAILLLDEEGQSRNQEMLMNKLQEERYKGLVWRRSATWLCEVYDFCMTGQEAYVQAHYELFAALVESQHAINMGKLQNIHSYSFLLDSLRKTRRLQLRRALRSYLNRLYYCTKSKDIFLFEEFLRHEFALINVHLQDIIRLHKQKAVRSDVQFVRPLRLAFAHSEVSLLILEILFTLRLMLSKESFIQMLQLNLEKETHEHQSYYLHKQLVVLIRHMGTLRALYPDHDTFLGLGREVLAALFPVIGERKEHFVCVARELKGNVHLDNEDNRLNSVFSYDENKSFFRNLVNSIRHVRQFDAPARLKRELSFPERTFIDQEIIKGHKNVKPFVQKRNFTTHQPTSLVSPQLFNSYELPCEDKENYNLNAELNTLKRQLETSSWFKLLEEKYFYRFVNVFLNYDTKSVERFRYNWLRLQEKEVPIINRSEFLKRCFRLLISGSANRYTQKFVLRFARSYITESVESKSFKKVCIDEWDSDQLASPYATEIFISRQKYIEKCGGSEVLLGCLKNSLEELPYGTYFLNELLLFGIAYLFGGNRDCQTSMLNALRQDSKNDFFVRIAEVMDLLCGQMIALQSASSEKKKNEASIVDSYCYYDYKTCELQKGKTLLHDPVLDEAKAGYESALGRVFRMLQLFCENGNSDSKRFLNKQMNERGEEMNNSVDFVQVTTMLLRRVFRALNAELVHIPAILLDFLAEITQMPCYASQKSLFSGTYLEDVSYIADFFSHANKLEERNFLHPHSVVALQNIFLKTIDLVLSNFEGSHSTLFKEFLIKCKPRFLWLVIKLNLRLLHPDYSDEAFRLHLLADSSLTILDLSAETSADSSGKYCYKLCDILKVICIVRKLKSFCEYRNELKNELKVYLEYFYKYGTAECPTFKSILAICEEAVISVEVTADDGRGGTHKQRVFFPKHPLFGWLGKETCTTIMLDVKRDTQRDKLLSLLSHQKEVADEIELNSRLKHTPLLVFGYQFEYTAEYAREVRSTARMLSYFICVMMLFVVLVDHDAIAFSSSFNYSNLATEFLLRCLCLLQLASTFWFLLIWLQLRLPLAMNKFESELEGNVQNAVREESTRKEELEGWEILRRKADSVIQRVHENSNSWWKELMRRRWFRWGVGGPLALWQFEVDVLSVLIFVAASVGGNVLRVEWYTLHLFEVFVGRTYLTNIFKAILQNIKKLGVLTMLAGVFIMVFNVVSFASYAGSVYSEGYSCGTIGECVLGLYTSEAIGDNQVQFDPAQFSFNIVYLVFMEMLLQEIVGGIMIDAFMSLKEEDEVRAQDMAQLCFICGESKEQVERRGSTFPYHIKSHYLWHYLFFLYELEAKTSTDLTGLYYYIRCKKDAQDTSWFPALVEYDYYDRLPNALTAISLHLQNYLTALNTPQTI